MLLGSRTDIIFIDLNFVPDHIRVPQEGRTLLSAIPVQIRQNVGSWILITRLVYQFLHKKHKIKKNKKKHMIIYLLIQYFINHVKVHWST